MANHSNEIRAYGEAKGLSAEQIEAIIDSVGKPNRAAQAAAEQMIDVAARPTTTATGEQAATERQVTYILTLLGRRERSGDAGGFFSGPTTVEEIRLLSRAEASSYINSLTGAY